MPAALTLPRGTRGMGAPKTNSPWDDDEIVLANKRYQERRSWGRALIRQGPMTGGILGR